MTGNRQEIRLRRFLCGRILAALLLALVALSCASRFKVKPVENRTASSNPEKVIEASDDDDEDDDIDEDEVAFYLGDLSATAIPLTLTSGITLSTDGNTLTATSIPSGFISSLQIYDGGAALTSFTCNNLPSWVTVSAGVVVINLVSEYNSGITTLTCESANGSFNIRLESEATLNILLSSSVDGNSFAFVSADAPRQSPDGKWLVFIGKMNLVEDISSQLIAQNLEDNSWFVLSSTDGTVATAGDAAVGDYFAISPDSSRVLFLSSAPAFGVTREQLFVKELSKPATAPVLVSVTAAGVEGNGDINDNMYISPDNGYAYFRTNAVNMGATSGLYQIVRKNLSNLATAPEVVSVTAALAIGSHVSYSPILSSDGTFLLMLTQATNLGSNGTLYQLIKKNVVNLATAPVVVSVTADGTTTSTGSIGYIALAADDSFVLFTASVANMGSTNGQGQVIKKSLTNLSTAPVVISVLADGTTQADQHVGPGTKITSDNAYALFEAPANNFSSGTGSFDHVFKKSLANLATAPVPITVLSDGTTALNDSIHSQSLSADGTAMFFVTTATNTGANNLSGLRHIYKKDIANLATPLETFLDLTPFPGTLQYDVEDDPMVLSSDGRYLIFLTDQIPGRVPEWYKQVAILDVDNPAAAPRLVSVAADGTTADGDCGCVAMDPTGRYVFFTTTAASLGVTASTQILRKDLQNLAAAPQVITTTNGATQANGISSCTGSFSPGPPVVTPDGNWLLFASRAANLGATGGTNYQIIRKSLSNLNAAPQVVSVAADGTTIGNGSSHFPVVSSDGSFVVFMSAAANLGGTASYQIIKKSLTNLATAPVVVSVAADGATKPTSARRPRLSPDDAWVYFFTSADNFGFATAGNGHVVRKSLTNLSTAPIALTMMGDGTTAVSSTYTIMGQYEVSSDGSHLVFYGSNMTTRSRIFHRDLTDLSVDPEFLARATFDINGNGSAFVFDKDEEWLFYTTGPLVNTFSESHARDYNFRVSSLYKVKLSE